MAVSVIDRAVASLKGVGLSGYEAKTYVALIGAGGPLNGYEVAKRSGVPRSTVYETLGKLVARGVAFELRTESDATQYVALSPDAFLTRISRDVKRSLETASATLPLVVQPPSSPTSYHLEGHESVLKRAEDLIAAAEDELYLSAWQDEADELEAPLAEAEARGVDVTVIRFGAGDTRVGHAFEHLFANWKIVLDRVGCRLLVLAQDRESVLIGGAVDDAMWALYSEDPAVVLVAVEYMRHDIAFQVLAKELGIERVEQLFAADPTLQRLERGSGAPGLTERVSRLL